MKKLLVVIMLFLCAVVYSQGIEKLDGNYWEKLTYQEKEIFIKGLSQGQYSVVWVLIQIDEDFAKPMYVYLNTATPFNEIIKNIDMFYKIKPKHTPIWLAFFVTEKKAELYPTETN